MAGRGIVSGNDAATCQARGLKPPCFRPLDPVLRAQAVGIVARALAWSDEAGLKSFPDQGFVDNALFNSVCILADYDVARGFEDGTYKPVNSVAQIQIISLISRAMVAKGRSGAMAPWPPSWLCNSWSTRSGGDNHLRAGMTFGAAVPQ